MLFSNIEDHVCRQMILDHYSYPSHKGTIAKDELYLVYHANNISCIDDISVGLKIINNQIIDAKFDGVACAITTSSTDILCGLIKGKNLNAARNIIFNYYDLIANKECDKELLQEAVAFRNIYKQTSRIGCATIGVKAIEKIINDYQTNEKTSK